jgi:hypothetical protein
MAGRWNIPFDPPGTVAGRCNGDSVYQGRQNSIRWLINFVGVVPPKYPRDVWIEHFRGGKGCSIKRWSANGKILMAAWKGCSKASSHPTQGSRHSKVNEPELSAALTIVIDHLQTTIYLARGLNVEAETLKLA